MKKEYPKYKWNLKLYEKEFSEKGFWVKFEKLVKSKYAEFFSDSKKIKENILIKRKSTLSKFDVIKAMMKLKNKLIDYNVLRLIWDFEWIFYILNIQLSELTFFLKSKIIKKFYFVFLYCY